MSRTAIPYLEQVRGALFWHLEWKTLDNQIMDAGKNCNDRRQSSSNKELFSYMRTTACEHQEQTQQPNPHNVFIWWSLLIEWSDWLNQVETKQISPPDSLFKEMITDGPGPIWRRAEKRIVEKHVLPIKSLNIWCWAEQNGRDGCCDTNWRSYMSGGQPSLKWFCSRKCTMKDSCIF